MGGYSTARSRSSRELTRTAPGLPLIHAGIMKDDRGLWIVWNSRDPEWTERRAPMSPPPFSVPPRRVWEGRVELVDPATGLTLARHRSDGFIKGAADGSRYLVGYYETNGGVPYFTCLRRRYPVGVGPGTMTCPASP